METRRETVWGNLNPGKTYIIHITSDIDGKPVALMETKGTYNNFIMSKDGRKRILNFSVHGTPYDVLVKYPDNKFYEIIEPEIEETECAICGELNNNLSLDVCRNGHKFHKECFCHYVKSTNQSAEQHMPNNIDGINFNATTGFFVELKCPICSKPILPEVLDLCENYEGETSHAAQASAGPAHADQNNEQWVCNLCTTQNHTALSYCEMCETPRMGGRKKHNKSKFRRRTNKRGKTHKKRRTNKRRRTNKYK